MTRALDESDEDGGRSAAERYEGAAAVSVKADEGTGGGRVLVEGDRGGDGGGSEGREELVAGAAVAVPVFFLKLNLGFGFAREVAVLRASVKVLSSCTSREEASAPGSTAASGTSSRKRTASQRRSS